MATTTHPHPSPPPPPLDNCNKKDYYSYDNYGRENMTLVDTLTIVTCSNCKENFSLYEKEYVFERHGGFFFCCSYCTNSWHHRQRKRKYRIL